MKIHLIAICGTGMGSFAGLLKESGHEVRGSDENVYPPMSDKLREWGIPVFTGFAPENLDWGPDLVIIGNVVTRKNPEAQAVLARKIPHQSFPAAMGEMFLAGRHSIVVTGTHGKTTTSALLAWLLFETQKNPGFLIGGALKNFPHSFRYTPETFPFVIEGDEYDTAFFDKKAKFFHYRPKTAIVTSLEFDHADIYADVEAIAEAFRGFVRLLPPEGRLLIARGAPGDPYLDELARLAPCRVERYAVGQEADWRAEVLSEGKETVFSLHGPQGEVGRFSLKIPGRHNIANATAALGVALGMGGEVEALKQALFRFEGVKRRQEERGEEGGVLLIDDFAHHPTAVAETLRAIKARYPQRRLWAIFEPRSATCRRNILEPQYVPAFDLADEIILARAHRAEEFPPEERFDPGRLAKNISARQKSARYLPEVDQIVATVANEARPGDVVLIMSNGGFGGIQAKLLSALGARSSSHE